MSSNPYLNAPKSAFWSKSVSASFEPETLVNAAEPLIKAHECVATAGSCFAANLIPYLENSGFAYLRTEERHSALSKIPPENLGYGQFSAAYGNIYTVRQLLQLFRRSLGKFKPAEDRWTSSTGVIDPFRPGLKYHALNNAEFDLLTAQHLRAVRMVFERADVFIFTLGLTEAWFSRLDGAVYPACPGTVAGSFDPKRHGFVNFSVAEISKDLDVFIAELRMLNPRVRIILTVSPVPLVATGTDNHVLTASVYSKSVLRVVAEQAVQKHRFVSYFPAYEIVTGPQAPDSFFEADRRSVSKAAIDVVMNAFLANCSAAAQPERPSRAGPHTPVVAAKAKAGETDVDTALSQTQRLSRLIADAECEEAMADRGA